MSPIGSYFTKDIAYPLHSQVIPLYAPHSIFARELSLFLCSFLHYFEEMYLEGYKEITQRAYSLLLTFGIFDMNLESFCSAHTERYNRAYSSFATILVFLLVVASYVVFLLHYAKVITYS